MGLNILRVGTIASVVLGSILAYPLSNDGTVALEKFRSVLQNYLRDMAETPLEVTSTVRIFDLSGKLRKVRRNKYQFEVTSFRKGGEASVSAHSKGLKGPSWQQMYTDSAAVFAAFAIAEGHEAYSIEVHNTGGAPLAVLYRSARECKSFEPGPSKDEQWRLALWCGAGQITFDKDDLVPVDARFEAAGLPQESGKNTLRSYYVQQEFQTISLPGEKRPLCLSKKITATYGTAEGRIVVENEYMLHQASTRKWRDAIRSPRR
ncbi:MAG: hypothetical protein ACE14L_01935 [Terriglobales bacterium]